MNNTDNYKFYHSIFEQQPDGKHYFVLKDVFDHFSEGAIISGTMFNFYKNCYPSARIKIVTYEDEE